MDARQLIAEKIARLHKETQSGLQKVFSIRSSDDTAKSPIRLLEIVDDTPAVGIFPIGFRPIHHLGITLPSVIVEITPFEYDNLRARKLNLPHGWEIGEEIELVR